MRTWFFRIQLPFKGFSSNNLLQLRVLNVKYKSTSLFLTVSFLFSGCAITSGLQTYDLPEQGDYTTEQGSKLSVVQLNQQNVYAFAFNHAQNSHSSAISHLFHGNQRAYTLSAGDVLSIQLWAYPEITPPIQDISNVRASGYPIDSSGNVQLPLIGQVRIAGTTLAETNPFIREAPLRW